MTGKFSWSLSLSLTHTYTSHHHCFSIVPLRNTVNVVAVKIDLMAIYSVLDTSH